MLVSTGQGRRWSTINTSDERILCLNVVPDVFNDVQDIWANTDQIRAVLPLLIRRLR
jgi:hypothetical protein